MDYFDITFQIEGGAEALIPAVSDVLMALTGECGLESFDGDGRTWHGYVQQEAYNESALVQALQDLPFEGVNVTYSVSPVVAENWNAAWESEGFDPIVLDDRVAIHDSMHPVQGYETEIEINARMAFGSGTHETTRLMVVQLMSMSLRGCRVLDCGTGTGILSIAAIKFGAAEAVGYDIDSWSVDNARDNARQNNADACCRFFEGDASSLSHHTEGVFDVVMANINRNILLADMPSWRPLIKEGGTLLLSGFYRDDVPLLIDRAKELSLGLTAKHYDGDWALLAFSAEPQ